MKRKRMSVITTGKRKSNSGTKAGAATGPEKAAPGGNGPAEAQPVVTMLQYPPPSYILEEAQKEVNRTVVADYAEPIFVLREKGFTFREIAEWLEERGVEADHNAVYRVYTRGMDEGTKAQLDQRLEEEEREG